MQFCEAVVVGLMNEDRVRVRDIQSTFDDRGRDENVSLTDELPHRQFHRIFAHLPMNDVDFGFGDDAADLICNRFDVVNAIVNEVDLSVTVQFTNDRRPDQFPIPAADMGFDRLPVLRRVSGSRCLARRPVTYAVCAESGSRRGSAHRLPVADA